MTTFAKDVRGEIAMAALGATERQRDEALLAAFACANAVVLDEAAVQAMIARDAERQVAVPNVMKVRRGRHGRLSSVSTIRTK
jgi:hypothetical protein